LSSTSTSIGTSISFDASAAGGGGGIVIGSGPESGIAAISLVAMRVGAGGGAAGTRTGAGGGAAPDIGRGGTLRSEPSGGASAASSRPSAARCDDGDVDVRTGGGGGREASTGTERSSAEGDRASTEGSTGSLPGRDGSPGGGRTESLLGRPMPSLARKSMLGCEERVLGPTAGGGLERGPGTSETGRVQAAAPPLTTGCEGSPPTTIIRARATPGLEGASAPNGLLPLPAGLGGGASLREAAGSEAPSAEGSATGGSGRAGTPSWLSNDPSTAAGSAAALFESWGSSIVMGS
jgi:hypothetical protein